MDIVNYIIDYSTSFISTGGILFGFFIVFLESFLPILPLSVFVALNVNAFGLIIGILISWLGTFTGSLICYFAFRYLGDFCRKHFLKKKTVSKIDKKINKFNKVKFTHLVLIYTLPFTPSCLVNLLSGLSKIKFNKFILSLLIGKLFSIIFWGYIGKSLIDSFKDINSIIFICIMLLISYVISKIVSRKFDLE